MPLFEYSDTPGETAIVCVCGHTCGPEDECTTCQPQPSVRRCRACKRGGTIVVDSPLPPGLPPVAVGVTDVTPVGTDVPPGPINPPGVP